MEKMDLWWQNASFLLINITYNKAGSTNNNYLNLSEHQGKFSVYMLFIFSLFICGVSPSMILEAWREQSMKKWEKHFLSDPFNHSETLHASDNYTSGWTLCVTERSQVFTGIFVGNRYDLTMEFGAYYYYYYCYCYCYC